MLHFISLPYIIKDNREISHQSGTKRPEMFYAVHAFFDERTESVIRSVWKGLSDSGLAPYLHQSANRPHLTLAIYGQLDGTAGELRLRRLADSSPSLPVTFSSLGMFTTPMAAVFLAPVVNAALLALHGQVHRQFAEIMSEPDPYYQPGKWVPHCALALELDKITAVKVLEEAMRMPLPLTGEITELGVIQARPVRHLFGFPLSH